MPDEKPKPDKPVTEKIEAQIKNSDPLKAAAVAVDNPAETVLEVAEEAADVEPVEEDIEAHTPPANPVLDGINTLLEKIGGMETRMIALEERQKATTPKGETPPTTKKEVKENVTPEEKPTRRGLRLKSRN